MLGRILLIIASIASSIAAVPIAVASPSTSIADTGTGKDFEVR